MRQGLLSEPKASSGPAAMLLAVSRSPSSIPRRSPCPDRCHLPLASRCSPSTSRNIKKHPRLHPLPNRCHLSLASLSPSISRNLKHIPDCIPQTDATFLWRSSLHPPHETSNISLTASPRPMPPSSGVLLHPPHEISKTSTAASVSRI